MQTDDRPAQMKKHDVIDAETKKTRTGEKAACPKTSARGNISSRSLSVRMSPAAARHAAENVSLRDSLYHFTSSPLAAYLNMMRVMHASYTSLRELNALML
jgi:hypothetical protein